MSKSKKFLSLNQNFQDITFYFFDLIFTRETRIMGAKKWTLEKRRCPLFFSWSAHYLQKKIMGTLPINFLSFFHSTEKSYAHFATGINFFGQNPKFWCSAHCAPINIFLFYRPLTSKKKSRAANCAPMFFLPPMILVSLHFTLAKFLTF